MLGVPTMMFFAVTNLLDGNVFIFVSALISAMALIVGMIILIKVNSGDWVYRTVAFLYICLISYMILLGGVDGSKALWSYTVPLICCFLFGYKEGGAWSALIVFIASFCFTQTTILSIDIFQYTPNFQIRFIITYTFCTIIAMWLEYSRYSLLKQSHAISTDLIKKQAKLEAEIVYRKDLEQELITTARIDPLTDTLNRGAFFVTAKNEWDKHVRNSTVFSFAVLDLDHFKSINDTYGHPIGDEVLVNIARCCIKSLRSFDLFGRIGGEEFALVFSETTEKEAYAILERLRLEVENAGLEYEGGTIRCTVSIGLFTSCPPSETLSDIYKKADVALYQAKNSGRNKICTQQEG